MVARQHRDRLDVRGVGEHVHGLDAQDAVARGDGERQLAGERLGVAGDENAPGGPEAPEDLADDVGRAAVARRVEDDGVEVAWPQAWERLLHGGAHELQAVLAHAVPPPIELRVPGRLPALLDRRHDVAAERDREREEATAAVEVEDAQAGFPGQRFDHEADERRGRRDVRLEEGRR